MAPLLSGAAYWSRRFGRWPEQVASPEAGYTLLVPVPGDLPVFLEMALRVCAAQRADHRVETIVLPDRPSPEIDRIVAAARREWSGPLSVQRLPRPERWYLPRLQSGSRNHALQLIAGVSVATASHIALHDADLFLLDDALLDRQYATCRDDDLDCLGLSPVWDDWFAARGVHLAATWDMMASVSWLRQWPPWRHMGHDAELAGDPHTFDTTLWAQARTPTGRVAVSSPPADFVHFNYVISSYRHFQRHGPGYVDDSYRLLFISLLLELFSASTGPRPVPPVAQLESSLRTGTGEVRYPPATEDQRVAYRSFRLRLGEALAAPYLPAGPLGGARASLATFDHFYGFEPPPGP